MKSFWRMAFFVAVALFAIASPAAWAGAANVSFDPGRVHFDAQVDYERAVLTVSMPGGEVSRQEFDAREALVFDLATVKDAADGGYTYELRLTPRIDAGLRKALAEARRSGDEAAIARLRAQLPEAPVLSGGFVVEAGMILMPQGKEPGMKSAADAMRKTTAADQVIPDDLIVQGSACVGLDCVNNENFGFDTIRLKENNLRIHFDDTSNQAGFPANDWRLIANDSASGGSSKFSIEDSTGAKTPFTVTAGAATNSIFVDSTGRLGLRTSTPVLDLHINTSNTPSIRLEQNNSGGFTAQTWDIGANEANFFVRDVTGGSRLPFRIRPGAKTSSIDISADSNVGIGEASPSNTLWVKAQETNDGLTLERGGAGQDTELKFSNEINVTQWSQHFDGDLPEDLYIFPAASSQDLLLQVNEANTAFGNVGIGTESPVSRLHVNGDVRVTGGSFIDDGTALNVPDYVFEPSYSLMPLAELESFVKENRHLPGIPNAGSVKQNGLNLSQFQLKLLEKVEELTLYVLAQKKEMDELRTANAALETRLAEVAGATSN